MLTEDEVRAAIIEAGWPADQVDRALCIAFHESGYNAWAVGDRDLVPDNGPSYGLFQINVHAHPDFDLDQWYDPLYNAAYALKVYTWADDSFEPWSTEKMCP